MSTQTLKAPLPVVSVLVSCTSEARHACTGNPTYECRGDGTRVLWCAARYKDWLWERDRLRCRDCGGPQAHWRVTPHRSAS